MTRGKTVTRPSAAEYRAHALSPFSYLEFSVLTQIIDPYLDRR